MLHTACASRSTVFRTEFLPVGKYVRTSILLSVVKLTQMLHHDRILRVACEPLISRYIIQDNIQLATATFFEYVQE